MHLFSPEAFVSNSEYGFPTIVVLERRRDGTSRQYSVEAELLLPGVVGTRMLGLMEQKGTLWSSALRLKYGVGGE